MIIYYLLLTVLNNIDYKRIFIIIYILNVKYIFI
jgi:hypothetical protein